jgi:pimeloyl-ACP methyl ester carboxylesterase
MFSVGTLLAGLLLTLGSAGCASHNHSQKVIFLDGAGHLGAATSVARGMRAAGYDGDFDRFVWTSFMLWGADHLLAARSDLNASRLASQVEEFRNAHPDGRIVLMGLSSGTEVIRNALARLPDGVNVDTVVFFQSSISATTDLSPSLEHVRNKLFATCSPKDLILGGLLVTADGKTDKPAGRTGFKVPRAVPAARRTSYTKVLNLPWQSKYDLWGWSGGHVDSTSSEFVRRVIYPRTFGSQSGAQDSQPRGTSPQHEENAAAGVKINKS